MFLGMMLWGGLGVGKRAEWMALCVTFLLCAFLSTQASLFVLLLMKLELNHVHLVRLLSSCIKGLLLLSYPGNSLFFNCQLLILFMKIKLSVGFVSVLL